MLVLASGNPNKLQEIRTILADQMTTAPMICPQKDFNITTPPETGKTFLENALLKARYVFDSIKQPVIAEDSGLIVASLNGAPGIYSARYAGEDASDEQNVAKLLQDMKHVPDDQREAEFCCVAVYLFGEADDACVHVSGHWKGQIARAPQGSSGFGYDPVFYLPQHGCTAAQLTSAEKNRISHRARAFGQLAVHLQAAC